MNRVLEEANDWHDAAQKLVEDSDLLRSLGEFGRAEVTGSFKYDLLMGADIDIYLIVPQVTKELAKRLANHFIDENWWHAVQYVDWLNFRYPGYEWLPESFYVRLQTSTEKSRWKVDIWLLTQEKFETIESKNPVKDGVSEEQRLAILELKDARNKKLINAGGQEIYEAVINKGVRSVKDFRGDAGQ